MKFYKVTFITKEHCDEIYWRIDIEAENKAAALDMVFKMWKRKPHMFHLKAVRLKPTEEFLYHTFVRLDIYDQPVVAY